MKISVPNNNGFLDDKYSKYAPAEYKLCGTPVCSFPVGISDVPKGAESLALVLVDFDSIPVCGFAWIHWLAANIPADTALIPENAAANEALGMVQGSNSDMSPFVGETNINITRRYIGPTPPDKAHKYKLTVYALDTALNLADGYFLNEFLDKADGHILEKASVLLLARS